MLIDAAMPFFISVAVIFFCASAACDFNPNTPEFVEKRKKMLDLLAHDKCGKNHPLKNPRPSDVGIPNLWVPQTDKIPGDDNCKEAFELLVRLPGPEIHECAGAIVPRCRRMRVDSPGRWQWRHQWKCTVLFHDADRIDPPITLTLQFCTAKSREVYAEYEQSANETPKEVKEVSRIKKIKKIGETALQEVMSTEGRKKILGVARRKIGGIRRKLLKGNRKPSGEEEPELEYDSPQTRERYKALLMGSRSSTPTSLKDRRAPSNSASTTSSNRSSKKAPNSPSPTSPKDRSPSYKAPSNSLSRPLSDRSSNKAPSNSPSHISSDLSRYKPRSKSRSATSSDRSSNKALSNSGSATSSNLSQYKPRSESRSSTSSDRSQALSNSLFPTSSKDRSIFKTPKNSLSSTSSRDRSSCKDFKMDSLSKRLPQTSSRDQSLINIPITNSSSNRGWQARPQHLQSEEEEYIIRDIPIEGPDD